MQADTPHRKGRLTERSYNIAEALQSFTRQINLSFLPKTPSFAPGGKKRPAEELHCKLLCGMLPPPSPIP